MTKQEKFEDQVWEVLFNHKALSKLDMASIFFDVMDKLKLPTLDRKGQCLYQKTKEWAEVCASTERFFIRVIRNSTGTFSERDHKRVRDCRKKK